ncbi:MAG: PQQ-binding-like beta-propeller repeat protein [Verrucomicrobiales bacterium]|nr:PQQ-binding-like beta-propeller repeat protein [Verrucomicrobiales bacterium]
MTAVAMLAMTASVRAETGWTQWRGPGRDGIAAGPTWPDSLDEKHLRLRWQVPLAPGYSGPIAADGRVFTTETADEKYEAVTAFDSDTGRKLWRTQWEGAMSVPFFAKSNGDWIRSTPAYAEGRLYVAGMRDVLVCLEAADGVQVWRMDFMAALGTPLPSFGFVCSPLVDGDAVYTQAGASVVRLHKADGRVVWRSMADAGGMMDSAFSSPVLADLAGVRQLVVQTREELAGLDPTDGSVLWRQPVKSFRGMNITTPVVFGDLVITSSYGGRTYGWRVSHDSGGYRVETAWEHKAQGYMSTPVVIGDYAYHHLRSQRVMCLDLRTGAEQWTSPRSFGKYWSLVAQGNRVLALDQQGELFLLDATPAAFSLRDSRRVSESDTWAHLAVADSRLFVRALDALQAWEWQAD